MKAIKIVLWDKTNDIKIQEFSNPVSYDVLLGINLQERQLWTKWLGGKTVLDLAPGDVFEIRVSEGLDF